jgi:hypothetical protein
MYLNVLLILTRIKFRNPYLFYLLVHNRCWGCFYFRLIALRHWPQSVGLLWTRDRPVAETSTWQHKHSQETNIHAPGGSRTHDPSKRSAADLRLRRRGHWDRLEYSVRSNDIHRRACNICVMLRIYEFEWLTRIIPWYLMSNTDNSVIPND